MRSTNRKIVGVLSGLTLGCVLAASAPVLAQGAPDSAKTSDSERARDLLGQGLKESAAGNYLTARSILLDAFKLSPSYDVAGTLAQVELKLERYRDSAEHLQLALRAFPPSESLKLKKQIEDALAAAKQHVETVTLAVRPDGAEVRIDNASVGTAPLAGDVFLDPGDHALEVRLNAHSSTTKTVHAAAGHNQVLEVVLSQPTSGTADPATAPPPAGNGSNPPLTPPSVPHDSGSRRSWTPAFAGGAVAVVGVAGGIVFWRLAASEQRDADKIAAGIPDTYGCNLAQFAQQCAELHDANQSVESRKNWMTASFIVGGAGAAFALGYVIWHETSSPEHALRVAPSLALGPSAAQLGVQGSF